MERRGITAVTLPHKLTTVYAFSFAACAAMQSIAFRPPVSRGAFIAWIVGSSRNRSNWQVTSVKHLRNVLRLITTMAVWSRDVTSLDPDGTGCVLEGCTRLTKCGLNTNTSGYPEPDSEDECERVEMEYEAYLREIGEL